MIKKQIKKFIEEIAGESLPIEYYYDNSDNSFMSYVKLIRIGKVVGYTICLNKYWFNRYKKDTDIVKIALMHEVGHFKTRCHEIKQRYLQEYRAELWAHNKAKKLGMKRIVNRQKKLLNLWMHCNWIKKRPYVMAARLAKKRGII